MGKDPSKTVNRAPPYDVAAAASGIALADQVQDAMAAEGLGVLRARLSALLMLRSHVGISGSEGVLYLDSRAATMLASTRAVGGWCRVERRVLHVARCCVSFASIFVGVRGRQSRGRADG